VSFDALDIGNTVTAIGGNVYQLLTAVPEGASGSVTATLEGRASVDVDGDGRYTDLFGPRDAFAHANVDSRGETLHRRDIVNMDLCHKCHDAAAQGISMHDSRRTGEIQACALCHNADATDIGERPDPPKVPIDGKREEAIDVKRMIHQIHAGGDLVVYGDDESPHDYSNVSFTSNLKNCETCHVTGSYDVESAWAGIATTVHSGDEVTDPSDDLNISSTTSVCASCHDSDAARAHMVRYGGSFRALDENIY
jgi:OmcA/MtrC family decaheme c-type cytochrome